MSVELPTRGRTREVRGTIYLERWVTIDAGVDQIYGTSPTTGDLNTLDLLADAETAAGGGRRSYGGASPGEHDPGVKDPAWYGQVITVSFYRLQGVAEWHLLKADLQAFIETAFPGELIIELNRRFQRPAAGSVDAPSKYVLFAIDYD